MASAAIFTRHGSGAHRANAPETGVPAQIRRAGLTLVEMMVSVTITLLVVFAIVQVFDIMGSTIAMGRATIEMAGQLRNVTNTLQRDLDNLTCPVEPWIDPDAGVGYFEYVEGPLTVALTTAPPIFGRSSDRDSLALGTNSTADLAVFGDVDDILAMTVRSTNEPFVGRGPTGRIESSVAEVVWWMALQDTNGNAIPDIADSPILLRRVLLVRPDLDLSTLDPTQEAKFFFDFDVSARFDGADMQANSLSDLSNRANRFAHQFDPSEFPHNIALFFPNWSDGTAPPNTIHDTSKPAPYLFKHEVRLRVDLTELYPTPVGAFGSSSVLPRFITQPMMAAFADFVVLSDVTAFDIKAFDNDALNYYVNGVAVSPGDFEYTSPHSTTGSATWSAAIAANSAAPPQVFSGAYVDLGFSSIPGPAPPAAVSASKFDSSPRDPDANGATSWDFVCYDTWSLGYERDGIDQDGDALIDPGFNGVDDAVTGPASNGIDDIDERETQPPYDGSLSGIEVRLRMLEFGTGQVRQASVIGDFTN